VLVDPYEAVRAIAFRSLVSLPGYQDLGFDYLAVGKDRRRSREDARERWRGLDTPAGPARLARLLLESSESRARSRVAELRRTRDDRRVFRAE
jgi:hypothetical protein